MKTLILAAALIAATPAVAAPDAPVETELTIALSPYEAQTQSAQQQFEAGDFAGAQRSLENALALAPTDAEKAETLLQLGALFDERERFDEARAAYQKALPLITNSPDDLTMVQLFIATTYVNQELWQDAADAWAQLAQGAPSPQLKATYQLALGQAYTELGQTEKAAQQLRELRSQMAPIVADISSQPDALGFALILVGRSYQTQNDGAAARPNFEAAAQLAQASSDLRVNALRSWAQTLGKPDGQIADERALSDVRQRLMNEASQSFAAREWERATAIYREAAQLGTPDAATQLSLSWQIGNALREQGDIDGARAEFENIVAMAPDAPAPMFVSLMTMFKPFSYYYLAQGYLAQGKFGLARAAIEAELALPDLQEPLRKQAEELRQSLPARATDEGF